MVLAPTGVGSRPTLYARLVGPGRVHTPSKSTPNRRLSAGFNPRLITHGTKPISQARRNRKGGEGESSVGGDGPGQQSRGRSSAVTAAYSGLPPQHQAGKILSPLLISRVPIPFSTADHGRLSGEDPRLISACYNSHVQLIDGSISGTSELNDLIL